jgi:hypothetical protein
VVKDAAIVADAATETATEATFVIVAAVPWARGGAVTTLGVMILALALATALGAGDLMLPSLGFTLVPRTLCVTDG